MGVIYSKEKQIMKKIVLKEDFLIPDTDIIAEPGDELYIEPAVEAEDDGVPADADPGLTDNDDYDFGDAPVDEEDGEDVSDFDADILDNDDLGYAERRMRNARCRAGRRACNR